MAAILPFLSKLHITDKTGRDLILGDVMAWPQRDLISRVESDINNRKPLRYIVLKARQIGMSTIIEGMMFQQAMCRQNFRGTVLAHKTDSSQSLLGMTHYYFDSFWARDLFTPKNKGMSLLGWKETNSLLRIATAGGKADSGRGMTPQWLHASEVAFWDKPKELMTGLAQSIGRAPGTAIFLESTANGVGGYYYNVWNDAVAGANEFTPVFYPWWAHPSYTAHHIGMGGMAEGTLVFVDDEEKGLVKFLQGSRTVNGQRYEPMDSAEIKSRLIWRRAILGTECSGDINTLHQEYPSVPDEAFIATGTNVFDLQRLGIVYEPVEGDRGHMVREGGKVRFVKHNSGPLEIYRYPGGPGQSYLIGGDGKKAVQSVSGGEGDYCCAQVLDRRTWDQCARWRGRLDQNSFGEQMIMLGQFYNNAILAPETGIGGPGVAAHILAKGYPNIWQHRKATKMPGFVDNTFGWISSAQTKVEAINNLISAIYDASDPKAVALDVGLRIHDPVTYQEMKNYIVLPDGGFGNADGVKEHDDTVMALAIALTCTKYEAAGMVKGIEEEEVRRGMRGMGMGVKPQEVADFEQRLGELGVLEGDVVRSRGDGNGFQIEPGMGEDAEWLDNGGDWYGTDDDW